MDRPQANGDFRFARAGLDLSNVSIHAGGLSAKGALALRDGEPSSADFTLGVVPGAFLAEGRLEGAVRLTGVAGASMHRSP